MFFDVALHIFTMLQYSYSDIALRSFTICLRRCDVALEVISCSWDRARWRNRIHRGEQVPHCIPAGGGVLFPRGTDGFKKGTASGHVSCAGGPGARITDTDSTVLPSTGLGSGEFSNRIQSLPFPPSSDKTHGQQIHPPIIIVSSTFIKKNNSLHRPLPQIHRSQPHRPHIALVVIQANGRPPRPLPASLRG
jgi:hypothetical protein